MKVKRADLKFCNDCNVARVKVDELPHLAEKWECPKCRNFHWID